MLVGMRCEQSGAKLRVLIAAESYAPNVNGVAHSVARLETHLRAHGHEVLVIAPDDAEAMPDPEVIRVPSRSLPMYRGLSVGLPSRPLIDQAIDRFRPDVVHLAAPVALGAAVGAAAGRRQIPIVAIFQTDLSGFARSYGLKGVSSGIWWWLRRVHRMADITLAPSTPTAHLLFRNGIPRVGLWGRGVDTEQFTPDRRSAKVRSDLLASPAKDDKPRAIVGFMGRLAKEKRVDLLEGIDRWADAQLVVVGDGPARADLERQLPNAHFTGMLGGDELAEVVASFDLFVHTGAHETFCQAVQEAMASGLPVVAPASGGPLDLVADGVSGLLYRPEDREDLERVVRALLDDPTQRKAMGAAGYARAVGRSWDRVCEELVEVYRRCRAGRVFPLATAAEKPLPPPPPPEACSRRREAAVSPLVGSWPEP